MHDDQNSPKPDDGHHLDARQGIEKRIAGRIPLSSPDAILVAIVSAAVRLTGAATGVIHVVSEDGTKLVRSAQSQQSIFQHPPPRLASKDSLTCEAINTGRVLVIRDATEAPRVNPLVSAKYCSVIAVPVMCGTPVAGVLFLNDLGSRDYSEVEVSVLSTLAAQAAIALDNANLLQELHQKVSDLTATTTVQSRLVRLMSNTKPTDLFEDLLLEILREIEVWPGVRNVTFLSLGEHDIDDSSDCEFLSDRQRVVAAEYLCSASPPGPFELPGNDTVCCFIPVESTGRQSTVLLVNLSASQIDIARPWLQMAKLILQYLSDIGKLLAETEALRHQMEQQQARALVGTISRVYVHEAVNGVKAIQCWIEEAKTRRPNYEPLELRVEELRANIAEFMRATDFWRLKPVTCEFYGELQKALKRLNYRDGRKTGNCKICVNLALSRRRRVEVDPATLVPILHNLVLNAQEQYGTRQGKIEITAIEKDVHAHCAGFAVRDYASGIPEEHLDRVCSAGWTTKPGGEGLGLWVVKKLVEACGGHLLVESMFGYSTTFEVLYPIFDDAI